MLVVDEVQSGIGRTGKWFAVEHTGVEPDMVCMAKGIASGMPLGVTMTRAEVMDWVPGSHASTFGGNPVCIAAALATLDVIEKEHLLENSAQVGASHDEAHGGLAFEAEAGGRCARTRADDRRRDRQGQSRPRSTAAAERDRIVEMAFERGVLFLGCGPSTVRICPPLVVTRDEADVAVDVLEECIPGSGQGRIGFAT